MATKTVLATGASASPLGTIVWSAVFPDAVDLGVDGILTAVEGLQETPPTEGQPT